MALSMHGKCSCFIVVKLVAFLAAFYFDNDNYTSAPLDALAAVPFGCHWALSLPSLHFPGRSVTIALTC
jgi:hypothetical protein